MSKYEWLLTLFIYSPYLPVARRMTNSKWQCRILRKENYFDDDIFYLSNRDAD